MQKEQLKGLTALHWPSLSWYKYIACMQYCLLLGVSCLPASACLTIVAVASGSAYASALAFAFALLVCLIASLHVFACIDMQSNGLIPAKTCGSKYAMLGHWAAWDSKTGKPNIPYMQSKGWVGWKGPDFWVKGANYNMCMPQRPKQW